MGLALVDDGGPGFIRNGIGNLRQIIADESGWKGRAGPKAAEITPLRCTPHAYRPAPIGCADVRHGVLDTHRHRDGSDHCSGCPPRTLASDSRPGEVVHA